MKIQLGQAESRATTCIQPIHSKSGAVGAICRKRAPVLGYSYFSLKFQLVAVGMLVAQHPPHRSLRAELPHKALASGHNAKRSGG